LNVGNTFWQGALRKIKKRYLDRGLVGASIEVSNPRSRVYRNPRSRLRQALDRGPNPRSRVYITLDRGFILTSIEGLYKPSIEGKTSIEGLCTNPRSRYWPRSRVCNKKIIKRAADDRGPFFSTFKPSIEPV